MKKVILILSVATLVSCSLFKKAQKIDSSELANYRSDVTYLADDKLEGREVGTKGEILAANFIAKRLKEMEISPKGINGTYFQEFKRKKKAHPHDNVGTGEEVTGRNVVGFLDNGAEKTIVIGAHYDHLGYGEEGSLHGSSGEIHNGADDNASGVAALLGLAKKLKAKNLKTNVLFIAFSGEEKGLWGSNFFAKNPTIPKSDIKYMINMDMVGRLDKNKRLAVYGIGTSPLFRDILEETNTFGFKNKYDSSGVGPSDHTSFYLEDIPVLHFFTGQHSDYHKPTDDTEFINFKGIGLVSNYIEAIVLNLNDKAEIPFTKTKSRDTKSRNFKVTLGVIPDYLYDGKGMKLDGVKVGRPAEKGGVIKGDIVIKMGDYEIKTMMDYMKSLGKFEKGQTIKVIVDRDGEILTKEITF